MRNKPVLRLLMLAILMITIFSCRNNELLNEQDIDVQNNNNRLELISKIISLEESKHKEKLTTIISDVQNKVAKVQNKPFGKNVNYNNIIIDTKNVTYIENGPNYHTYTFRIFRDNNSNDGLIENLLLTPLPDGSYKEFLITYNFTEQERKKILSGGDVSRKGKMNIVELDKETFGNPLAKSSSCSYQNVDVYISCADGVHNSSNVGSWGSCIHKGKPGAPVHYSFVALVCVDDPDSPGGIGSPPSGGGGGGGGTTNPNPNPPCVTTPTNPTGVGLVDNDGNPCTVGVPTTPNLSSFSIFVNRQLPADLKALINDSSNSDFYQGLQKIYDFDESQFSKDLIKWALQFRQNNVMTWEEFEPMYTTAYNFLLEYATDTINPEQIFSRMIDLDNAVAQNPNLLLDIDCAQLSQLDDWSLVATHSVPQTVKDKIQNIKNQTSYYDNWMITDLDNGLGARLNMDLFPVKITSLPNKPGTSQKYTPEEFFQFFRKNINLFAEKFSPIKDDYYGIDDTALWFSNNPLGALIHIQINPDDGTVVCSGFSSNTWIFSTVKAPLDWYHDGIHPVAGNRAFSYYTNPNDGSITIYTRGVDRVSRNYSDKAAIINHIIESLAFNGADNLWEDMQEKLKKHIVDNGGQADIVPAVKYRPKYSKIKDYVKGKLPISSLSCN